MKLKKSAIAGMIIAASSMTTPAFAEVGVSIGIGIPLPPPAVIYEPVPLPPAYGYVWAPGYWAWNHDRYIWIRGRHVYGRPGFSWRPERWEHRGERYHFVSGGWEREHGHGRARGRGHD